MKVTKRKIQKKDWDHLADYICDTHSTRKNNRKDLEKQWADIDRQIEMRPDKSHKLLPGGGADPNKAWMPEMELPLQAQTLEMLTADAARMQFADSGNWFSAHAELTDEYLNRVDFKSLIAGDENDVPSTITQDNVDKLVQGASNFWQNQYDFRQNVDRINGESFKYGMGVGRGRLVTKSIYQHTTKGVVKGKQKIPVLFPRSIKNTYPDDSQHHLMNEGHIVGTSVIFEKTQRLSDLVLAAKGSANPNDENGGWMRKNVSRLKPNKHGEVSLLEYEGDMVIPRSSADSIYVPNTIITVAAGEGTREIVRVRYNKYPFSSYVLFPYHCEHLDSAYPTSPLMKGRPIQIAAVDSLNQMIMAGQLNVLPPIRWDKDDPELAVSGGPQVYPGALWGAATKIDVNEIGNPTALMGVYMGLLQQYANVTGINAPRLGAQTVSHTTAFAKESEISRGTIRTVDYVKSTLSGPLEKWLHMEYEMGREELGQNSIYIAPYGGFVEISKNELPKRVVFEAHGSGGPAEENAKSQQRLASIQMALQVHSMAAQMGIDTGLDLGRIIEQTLRQGGWTDIDALMAEPAQPGMPEGQLPGVVTGEPSALT
jgi:hypothetical protein